MMVNGRDLRGLSLVELLVAMAILGFLLAGLLSLISGTAVFTSRATSQADRVRDLSDASGFIADSFRSSTEVIAGAASVTVNGGSGFDCEPNSCLAFFTPTFDAVTGAASGEVVPEVYTLVARNTLPPEWFADPPWEGATTNVLVRYVGVPVTDASSLSVDHPPSLVLDNIHNAAPFQIDATGLTLTIRLSSARIERGTLSVSPTGGQPLVTQVTRRNP